MSISIPGESKNKFSIKKGKNSSKERNLSLYNFFPSYTKPTNLNNNKNNNIINSSTTYFTTSKKPQRKNFFKVITPSLYNNNNNINKKNEIIKNKDNINELNDNISLSEKEKKEKLLLYFKGKKIYIEIFNGKENASSVFLEILLQYKIIQCKRLCKNIDYIIFKEGHLKTKKYAVMNNIKMVNPLWVDDKINRNIFKDDKEYFVETNMGDILVQENLGKNNNSEKNYENELEAEFDVEYANMIDKQRENKNKSKDEKNNTKQKYIGREKRKNKMTKNKNEILFLSEYDHEHDHKNEHDNKNEKENKNMVIDDFLETNYSTKNIINDNKNEINNEEIKEVIQENTNENNSKNNPKPPIKKNNPFKIEKMIKKDNINNINNNNINNINNNNIINLNDDIHNKNPPRTRSKTPDKIKPKTRKRIRTKSYKHKATSKKIMVTKVQEIVDDNENEKNNISPNKTKEANNKNDLNKENQNINSNMTPYKNKHKDSNDISDILNKDKNKDKDNSKNKNITPKKSTLGQKINIITYKLEEKEIQCLKTMDKFEYKGDLKHSLIDYGTLYSSASVIILDKDKSKYDWKMYEFFVDKKILVDFASFLFEFITEKANEDIIDAQNTLDKINKISINEESYFLNKKIRYQRRSLLHSINIVEHISDHKKEKEENENKRKFNFVINKNITGGEKRILHKIIKVFLKANIIKVDFLKAKRSHSVGPGIKYQLTTESIFSDRKENIFLIEKIDKNNDKMDIIDEKENDKNENMEEEEDEITNEDKNENSEVKGDTYLISKEKIVNRGLIKIIPNLKEVISYKYVFDSFWAGELINLNDDNILKRYQFI